MNESSEKLQSELTQELTNIFGSEISPKDKPKVERFIALHRKSKENNYLIESHQPKGLGNAIRRSLEYIAEINSQFQIILIPSLCIAHTPFFPLPIYTHYVYSKLKRCTP